jgi:hypothetical protein
MGRGHTPFLSLVVSDFHGFDGFREFHSRSHRLPVNLRAIVVAVCIVL